MTTTSELLPDRPRRHIPRRPADDLDPGRLMAAVARAVIEAEVGRRPLWQLEPVVSPHVLGRLALHDDRVRRHARQRQLALVGPGPAAVLRVVAQRPTPEVCNGTVITRRGDRIIPLVMRAERRLGVWRIVELARPHDGRP